MTSVNGWLTKVDESRLSVDAIDAHERCWRCSRKGRLERCHIIPRSLGGNDEPSNLVLLCPRCHLENPNVKDPLIMWDWLYAYKTVLYDTFWFNRGMEEYQKIYGKSFQEELKELNLIDENKAYLLLEFKNEIKHTTYHFGHPYLNSATIAGVLRIVLRKHQSPVT